MTIGEARPLVKYQEQFLGGNNAFISLLHNQIVEYFQVFAEMVKTQLEKASFVNKLEISKKIDLSDSADLETNEVKKIKGLVSQSLEQFETVPLNSLTLLSVIKV